MVAVTVRTRIPSRDGGPGVGDLVVDLPSGATPRDLIGAVVTAQLAQASSAVWEAGSRLYMTDAEIAVQAATGSVRLDRTPPALPTVATATARAIAAYQRGVFVIFAGAAQAAGLDEALPLAAGDRIVFLRLTALAGG